MDIIVYDFDGTIYDGDSSIDFYKFCIRRNPAVLKHLPYQIWFLFLYFLRIVTKTRAKEVFFSFLRSVGDVDGTVERFWQSHQSKILPWYKDKEHSRDVIISASPEFLLKPIAKQFAVYSLIASRVDTQNGRFDGLNCYGEEKVYRLKAEIPQGRVVEFYTDSLSDKPLMDIAQTVHKIYPSCRNNSFFLASSPLYFIFLLFALTTLGFVVKIPVNPYVFIVSFIVIAAACVFLNKQTKVRSLLFIVSAIIIPILLSLLIYDTSWDGNAYHKTCAGLMKEQGWNPIYERFDEVANASALFDVTMWAHWWDAYPKGDYILIAAIYSFFGNIECGKAYHLMALISAFLIILYILGKDTCLKKWQAACISAALTITPVTVGQMFTHYNDALLSNLLMITIVEFVYIYHNLGKRISSFHYINIFVAVTIAVNLKFSGLIVMLVPCVMFLLAICFRRENRMRNIRNTLAYYMVTVISAVGVFGVTSYGHNMYYYHNPVYSVYGEGKENILLVETRPLDALPNIGKLVGSVFSEYMNNIGAKEIPYKIPFTTSSVEFVQSIRSVDADVGGWGIFYSGLLALSLIYFVFRIVKGRRIDRIALLYMICLIMTFVPAFVVPGLSSARYWPYPFLFPAWLLFALFSDNFAYRNNVFSVVGIVVSLIVFLNILPALGGNGFYLYKTVSEKKNYQKVADYIEATSVDMENNVVYGRWGLIYNLHDKGIRPSKIISISDVEAEKEFKAVDLIRGSIFLPGEYFK